MVNNRIVILILLVSFAIFLLTYCIYSTDRASVSESSSSLNLQIENSNNSQKEKDSQMRIDIQVEGKNFITCQRDYPLIHSVLGE